MSRRGHLYGMISTYHHSWFLKADGKGTLWVSDAVGADAFGDAEHVSVTEVRPLDFLRLTLDTVLVSQHVYMLHVSCVELGVCFPRYCSASAS